MATEAKKHHYVPQSVLRRFTIGGDRKRVYVFDKSKGTCWVSSIRDAGSENQFNTLEIEGKRISFEGVFQKVDGRLAHLLDRVASKRDLASLEPKELADLADVVAVQLLRTKLIRTSMRTVAEDLAQSMSEAGFNPGEIENFCIPTEQDVRVASVRILAQRDKFRDALNDKSPVLIEASSGERFWISDNPVVMFNSFPYGEVGLNAPGIEVYYPFAPNLALGFFCRSIVQKLGEALALPSDAIPVEMRRRFADVCEAIASGKPTSLAATATRFVNQLQVRQSSRFLYASADDFALAHEVLRGNPEMRCVKTLTIVGSMGTGLPPNPRMPPGLQLVIHGRHSHHMLAVEEWNERSRFIEVNTRDVGTLNAILRDQPLQQAVLFQNGAERRGMRQIKIELVGQSSPQQVRILHDDNGLNAILG